MIKSTLFRVVMLCMAIGVLALPKTTAQTVQFQYPAESGSLITYSLTTSGSSRFATVTGVETINDGSIVLPDAVPYGGSNYKVTTIESNAINGGATLTSVVIPGSVTTINQNAFSGSTALKTVVLLYASSAVPPGFHEEAFANGLAENATFYVRNGAVSAYKAKYPSVTNIVDPKNQLTLFVSGNEGRLNLELGTRGKAMVALTDARDKVLSVREWLPTSNNQPLSTLFGLDMTGRKVVIYSKAVTNVTLKGLGISKLDPTQINDIQTMTLDAVNFPQNILDMPYNFSNLRTMNLVNMAALKEIDVSKVRFLNKLNLNDDMMGLTACALDRMFLALPKSLQGATCTFSAGTHNQSILSHSKTYLTDSLKWTVKVGADVVTGDGAGCDSLYLFWESPLIIGVVRDNGALYKRYTTRDAIDRNKELVVYWGGSNTINRKTLYDKVNSMKINGKEIVLSENNTFRGNAENVTSGWVTIEREPQSRLSLTQLADNPLSTLFVPVSIPYGTMAVKYKLPDYALVARELADVATPQVPQEGMLDLMARYEHPYTSFKQHLWAEMNGVKVDSLIEFFTAPFVKYYLNEVVSQDMEVTPTYEPNTFRYSRMQQSFTPGVADTEPFNTYTLAALDGVQQAADGTAVFFVQPADAEICKIVADWDGEKFIIPTQSMRSFLGREATSLHGFIDYRFNTPGIPTLQAGQSYEFLAYVRYNRYPEHEEQPGVADAPARGQRAPVRELTSYMLYPLDLDGTRINTGITDVVSDASSAVVATEYVDASGRVSDKPFNGLNIIRHHHANGSVTTSKQMIR